jgi:ADP-ribose pyrophosphatase YjhB (NUDIX family)
MSLAPHRKLPFVPNNQQQAAPVFQLQQQAAFIPAFAFAFQPQQQAAFVPAFQPQQLPAIPAFQPQAVVPAFQPQQQAAAAPASQPQQQKLRCTNCVKCRNGVCSVGVIGVNVQKNAIVLGRNEAKQIYDDLGGMIDAGESVEDAAIREIHEESAGSISLNCNQLTLGSVTIPAGRHCHKAFIADFKNVSCSKFYANYKAIKNVKNVPHCFKENDALTYFPIDKIKKDWIANGKKGLSKNQETDRGHRTVFGGRIRSLLHMAFTNGLL